MAKLINTDAFYKSILSSDIAEWRSELPQQGTIQTGRYTYEALVCEEHTKFLVYIFPEPFAEDETKYRVHLDVLWKVGLWVPIETREYKVHLSGAHNKLESWPATDDEILAKFSEIASNARPGHTESSTLN